jgi:CheY-like chemotaxis protein
MAENSLAEKVRKATKTPKAGATSRDERHLLSQVHVLIADDDNCIRETMRLVFEDEGYQVDEASNGKVTLELMRGSPDPYVVLLDLMMPQLGGAEVLAIMAEEAELSRRHAVLLVTASSCAAQGILGGLPERLRVPLIRKPFDLDNVLSLVAKCAERLVSQEDTTLTCTPGDGTQEVPLAN